jgi:hypothetical protein
MESKNFKDSEKLLSIVENLLEENNAEMFLAHVN